MSLASHVDTAGIGGLLTPERVRLGVRAAGWREAVRAAGALMVDTGTVEPRYVDAMIRSCERFGPYIVIAPGLALPHSRAEDGAIADSFSLVTLASPVEFGNEANDPVHVVLALSASNSDGHIEQLRKASTSLGKLALAGDDWRPLREASSAEEAINIISGVEEDEN